MTTTGPAPYDGVTAVSVVWNEGHRIAPLVSTLATWFRNVVIVVQKSDDDTLAICQKILTEPTHHVVEDEWRGGGDFSMPLALSHVPTEWTYVISGDEFPDLELLRTMPDAIAKMESEGFDGAFLYTEEWIEDVPYYEHGRHVRLFRTAGGWEARHHSAAPHDNVTVWPHGRYLHRRTLDEMVRDYLRKLNMMEAEGDQLALHNKATIYRVCTMIAAEKGWRFVRSHEWWPEVERRIMDLAPSTLEQI